MKKVFAFAAVFALLAPLQAFAFVGAGAHYVTNTGSLKSSSGYIGKDQHRIRVDQKGESVLQGMGLKFWFDFLPIVDVEGTFNFAATRYKTILVFPAPVSKEVSIEYKPDAPYNLFFDRASPLYGLFNWDLTMTKPIDILPFIRPYAGLGFSYFASIPIVDRDFVEKIADKKTLEKLSGDNATGSDAADLRNQVIKALKKSDYRTGVGMHMITGFRVTAIPFLKPYANVKYYVGGDITDRFTQGVVFEVGGGFAI